MTTEWQCDDVTMWQSDGASGNGRNVRNDGGKFGRDKNEIWMGFNGKEMKWNMIHDTASGKFKIPVQVSGFKVLVLFPLFVFLSIRSPHYHIIQLITFVYLLSY